PHASDVRGRAEPVSRSASHTPGTPELRCGLKAVRRGPGQGAAVAVDTGRGARKSGPRTCGKPNFSDAWTAQTLGLRARPPEAGYPSRDDQRGGSGTDAPGGMVDRGGVLETIHAGARDPHRAQEDPGGRLDASESHAAQLGAGDGRAGGSRDLPPCITKKGFLSEVFIKKT